jgi:hypothetical protein
VMVKYWEVERKMTWLIHKGNILANLCRIPIHASLSLHQCYVA